MTTTDPRTRRLSLAATLGTTLAVAAACSSSGGKAGPGGNPTPTPVGCDSAWRVNDAAYANDFYAELFPQGTAVVSNGTLVLTFNGTLIAGSNVEPNPGIGTGVLYSKRVVPVGDFGATVHFDGYSTTNTNLAAFFAVMGDPGGVGGNAQGGRVTFFRNRTVLELEQEVLAQSGTSIGGSVSATSGYTFSVSRTGGVFSVDVSGPGMPGGYPATRASTTSSLSVGFGIANYTKVNPNGSGPEPTTVSGSVTARFSGLVVTTTSGTNCFANGLQ